MLYNVNTCLSLIIYILQMLNLFVYLITLSVYRLFLSDDRAAVGNILEMNCKEIATA